MKFRDKVVLITGASSGIGKATALLFAEHGAKVVISYKVNKQGADDVVSEIEKLGTEALSVQADLKNEDDAKRLVSEAINKFGKIDILVNNAGRYISGDDWSGETKIWEDSLSQNLVSVLTVSKFVLEQMHALQSGVIVNISSRYSIAGQYDAPAYAASKAGIVNITQGQAKLMAPWGRSNAVSPGSVRAGYWLGAPKEELEENLSDTPLQKLVEPEDIAEAVVFLASNKAKMITGQNLIIDGGYTLI